MLAQLRFRTSFSHCLPLPFTKAQFPLPPPDQQAKREHRYISEDFTRPIPRDLWEPNKGVVAGVEKTDLGLSNLAQKGAGAHKFLCGWLTVFVGVAEPKYSAVGPQSLFLGQLAHLLGPVDLGLSPVDPRDEARTRASSEG